jgi:hypothetical protein
MSTFIDTTLNMDKPLRCPIKAGTYKFKTLGKFELKQVPQIPAIFRKKGKLVDIFLLQQEGFSKIQGKRVQIAVQISRTKISG